MNAYARMAVATIITLALVPFASASSKKGKLTPEQQARVAVFQDYEDEWIRMTPPPPPRHVKGADLLLPSGRLFIKSATEGDGLYGLSISYYPDRDEYGFSKGRAGRRCVEFAHVVGLGVVCITAKKGGLGTQSGYLVHQELTTPASADEAVSATAVVQPQFAELEIARAGVDANGIGSRYAVVLFQDGGAALYGRQEGGLIEFWDDLADAQQIYIGAGVGAGQVRDHRPAYFRADDSGHIQVFRKQDNGRLTVVTVSPEDGARTVAQDVLVVHANPEQPGADFFRRYTYSGAGNHFEVFVKNQGTRAHSYQFFLARPLADADALWDVLGSDGGSLLPEAAIGMAPIIVQEGYYNSPFPAQQHGNPPYTLNLAHGWLAAYPDLERDLVWGWASPELSSASGPIWQEVSFVSLPLDSPLLFVSNFTDTTEHFLHKSRKAHRNDLLGGPLLVAQKMDGRWQLYANQVYVDWSTYQSTTAIDRAFRYLSRTAPNDFLGAIPDADTQEEAVADGLAWLEGWRDDYLEQPVQSQMDFLQEVVAQRLYAANVQAYNESVESARRARRTAQEERRQAQDARDRQEAAARAARTAALIQQVHAGSFNNTLRNIRSAGNHQRTMTSLRTMTEQLERR